MKKYLKNISLPRAGENGTRGGAEVQEDPDLCDLDITQCLATSHFTGSSRPPRQVSPWRPGRYSSPGVEWGREADLPLPVYSFTWLSLVTSRL